jgi:hypothetical protein
MGLSEQAPHLLLLDRRITVFASRASKVAVLLGDWQWVYADYQQQDLAKASDS